MNFHASGRSPYDPESVLQQLWILRMPLGTLGWRACRVGVQSGPCKRRSLGFKIKQDEQSRCGGIALYCGMKLDAYAENLSRGLWESLCQGSPRRGIALGARVRTNPKGPLTVILCSDIPAETC